MTDSQRRKTALPAAPQHALEAPSGSPHWIAAVMPWAISLMFHLGVALILAFLMIVVQVTPAAPPDMRVVANPLGPRDTARVTVDRFEPQGGGDRTRGEDYAPQGQTPSRDPIIDAVSDRVVTSLTPSDISSLTMKRPRGTRNTFLDGILDGTGGKGDGPGRGPDTWKRRNLGQVDNIIFVIDRSGSMATSMEFLKLELKRAVRQLEEKQRFHVVMFAAGAPEEFGPKRLVPATSAYLEQFCEFASQLGPHGKTDPLPALKRAFEVAKGAPKGQYTAICLLSDAAFPQPEAAVTYVQQAVAGTEVHVFTYLYGHGDKAAEEMMKKIATAGRGEYNLVLRNDD